MSQVSAPVSNKRVQGKTTETGAPDRSPTAPGHPEAGDTPRDPRAQRHRDAGRRQAGWAAPRPVRAADRSRAARLSEETPVAAAGPSARPGGRHTPAPGGADGPRVRARQETQTEPRGGNNSPSRRGSESPAHRPSPQRRGGQPLPAPGAPLGDPALSRLPSRRAVGTPAVLSNGAAGGGRQRPGPGRRTRGPGSTEAAPRSLRSGAGLASPADCTGAGEAGAGPRGPQRQWGRSRGGAAQRGRAGERFRGTRRRPAMSSERGNVSRTRPQRHQNARAFKNDKYDTSARCKVGGGGPGARQAGAGPGRDTRACPGLRSHPSAGDAALGAVALGRASCRMRGQVPPRPLKPCPVPERSGARS